MAEPLQAGEFELPSLSRREFLQAGAGATLVLGLGRLTWAQAPPAAPAGLPAYGDWRDVYRERWRWDRIARGTHTSANCVAACAWNLYVREGIVWREEQSAPYAPSNASVPDWNPRGCQKGASCSELTIGATRQTHPLRRVGPRGSGRWKRVGWDEALGEIARAMLDALVRRGGEGVVCELGGNFDYGPTLASTLRFFRQIGAPITDPTAQTGDLPVGGVITLGAGFTGGSSDDWFLSDYLVLWAFNPVITRMPDAHFLAEARYRGARVVCVAPDYSASAVIADLWLSPRPGTDAALALAACQVIVEEERYEADYLREQTDLPFLVRDDTRRYLRESDVVKEGREDRFAFWDEQADALVWAPGTMGSDERSIALGEGVRPALDASAEVGLASGERVAVRTVFSLLRERLDGLRPERAAHITGIAPSVIRRFAREFADAPSALILAGLGGCKHYHSDLIQRAEILLASLTGNLGKAGGGWQTDGFINLEGIGLVGMQDRLGILPLLWLGARAAFDPEEVQRQALSAYVPSTLFHTLHAGLGEARLAPEYGDPGLPRPPSSYLDEALAQGDWPMAPPPGADPPEVVFCICGNVLRHSSMGERVRDTLFAQAQLVVDVGFRMSETSRYADIVLPAAAWYEKMGLKYLVGMVPYIHLADRAVAPLGEAKPEWEIYSLLARSLAAEAKRRGVREVKSFRGEPREIARLDERFGDGGRFPPEADEDVLRFILDTSSPSDGITLEDLRREGGAIRVRSLGPESPTSNFFTEYHLDEPVTPFRDFTEKKRPYPTLTGRQQFYVDHPWFLELSEELPTYKEPPAAGGDHPLVMTSGHTRWSIHSMWRDQALMLRLQRGEPVIYLNSEDARARGIADHDWVHVWNDVGSFEARGIPTGGIRPGQVHMFDGWEPFQFRTGTSHHTPVPSPIKPLQLALGYGQLRWSFSYYEPNAVDRDTRVNVRKV
ncbi:MAG: molybdopterin-dependent oxidoreductase [Deltaproteobacteria bacterium]|nr:molybdopterin-dependent oxidoreductase [Deltaproteobacteria bacterium]